MGEERDWLFESDEVMETIRRYEDMTKKRAQYFFDVHELEEIINHYVDLNNLGQALSAANYALRLYPNSLAIQLKIAQLLVDRGKANEALHLLHKLGKIEGSNYEIYVLKGSAYNNLGKYVEAQSNFDMAISLSSEENLIDVLYNIGVSFEHQNNFETAIVYLAKAYHADPTNISVLYDLAYCYDQIGQLENSILYYDKYLDEDPFSDNAWFNLGTVYSRVPNEMKAIEAYDFAIAINEEYASAYYNKANILSNLEKYDDALPEYLEFLKFEEGHVMAHCYIGECYEKLHRYEESLFFFQKAIALDSNCADAWFGKGIVKMHLQQYGESLLFIQKALDFDENNVEYLYAAGLVYMRQSDNENGIQAFKRVVEFDPNDYEAWLNYSELLVNDQCLDAAIDVLHRACEHNFNNPYINLRMASYLFVLGEMRQGYIYLDKALSLNPDDIEELYDFYPQATDDAYIMAVVEKHFNQNLV